MKGVGCVSCQQSLLLSQVDWSYFLPVRGWYGDHLQHPHLDHQPGGLTPTLAALRARRIPWDGENKPCTYGTHAISNLVQVTWSCLYVKPVDSYKTFSGLLSISLVCTTSRPSFLRRWEYFNLVKLSIHMWPLMTASFTAIWHCQRYYIYRLSVAVSRYEM